MGYFSSENWDNVRQTRMFGHLSVTFELLSDDRTVADRTLVGVESCLLELLHRPGPALPYVRTEEAGGSSALSQVIGMASGGVAGQLCQV